MYCVVLRRRGDVLGHECIGCQNCQFPSNADTPKQVVGYSKDPDHNSKGVLRFFLKNPFWETLEKRVSTQVGQLFECRLFLR
jgi:hypothetical protein